MPSQVAIKLSPEVMKLIAKDLYNGSPLSLLPRELLQNAVDACLMKGVEPNIRFVVEYTSATKSTRIICTDNGIGMDPEVIMGAFTTIGETNKNKPGYGLAGGFGIAGALIFFSDEWSIKTLKYEFNKADSLDENGRIRETNNPIDGTEISVVRSGIRLANYALQMMYFNLACSEVVTHLTYIYDGVTHFDDFLGGISNGTKIIEHDRENDPPMWVIRSKKYIALPDFVDPDSGQNFGGHKSGLAFVRLGIKGLVQFQKSYNEGAFMLIDLLNTPLPTDPGYPLNASREELRSINYKIDEILFEHRSNPITSRRSIEKQETPLSLIEGHSLYGTHDTDGGSKPKEGRAKSSIFSLNAKFEQFPVAFSNALEEEDGIGNRSPIGARVLLSEYRRKDIPLNHWRLLKLWGEILQMIAPQDEEFGLGLTMGSEGAARITFQDNLYYTINPSLLRTISSDTDGMITTLWVLACHEQAHRLKDSHGEEFDSVLFDIALRTASALGCNRLRLKRVWTGKEPPSWLCKGGNHADHIQVAGNLFDQV